MYQCSERKIAGITDRDEVVLFHSTSLRPLCPINKMGLVKMDWYSQAIRTVGTYLELRESLSKEAGRPH